MRQKPPVSSQPSDTSIDHNDSKEIFLSLRCSRLGSKRIRLQDVLDKLCCCSWFGSLTIAGFSWFSSSQQHPRSTSKGSVGCPFSSFSKRALFYRTSSRCLRHSCADGGQLWLCLDCRVLLQSRLRDHRRHKRRFEKSMLVFATLATTRGSLGMAEQATLLRWSNFDIFGVVSLSHDSTRLSVHYEIVD